VSVVEMPFRRPAVWTAALVLVLTAACGAADPEQARPAGDTAARDVASQTASLGTATPAAPDTLARSGGPRSLIGDYATNGDTLILREHGGRLEALVHGGVHDLEPENGYRFTLGGAGSAPGVSLVFEDVENGVAGTAVLGDVAYRRLAYSKPGGQTFRIDVVRPVAELRREAATATPLEEDGEFREPDLVDLTALDPSIRLDIRYATTNNFMGDVFYDEARALLQRPAAEALVRAHRRLEEEGLGLLVFDAYRPWYVTWMFWYATPGNLKDFVARPDLGSRHNRGAAVDLTLYDRATGEPLPMPSGYDEFSPRAHPQYPGGTSEQRANRDLLRRVMEAEGFRVYHAEWWHFDHREWRRYPILNLTFDAIG
jgi:D-alanyl-D-alanine dipeptidase